MDLLIIIVLSLLAIPLVALDTGILRMIVGIIFVLFIPGYAFISLLFPKRSSLGDIERFVLSIGTSMAIVVFIGLVLNFTPFGIRLWPIIISLLIFILATSGFAWFRRSRLPSDERFSFMSEIGLLKSSWSQEWLNHKYRLIILSVLVILATGFITYIVINSRSSLNEKSDEFYLLSQNGTTQNYPRTIHLGETVIIKAVIVNHQSEATNYSIKVLFNGQEIKTFQPIHVLKDEKWMNDISFIPEALGNNQKVEYWFFKADKSEPESQLYIWIDVIK